jgi:DNA primase large subunit
MDNLELAYKYPFSSYAKKEIEGHVSLLKNEYLGAEAKKRLLNVLVNGEYPIIRSDSQEKRTEELVIYAIIRMMLTNLANSYVTGRFAISFSKSFYNKTISNKQEVDEELKMLFSEFSINYEKEDRNYITDAYSFVKYAPQSIDYNMLYREIKNGKVRLNFDELKRMLQEAITRHLYSIPKIETKDIYFNTMGNFVLSKIPKKENAKVSFKEGDNPPCVEKLLDEMRMHKNLGHYARWSLAVYLMNRNVEMDDILKIFSNSPDYNEKISSYQIKHIIEHKYSMPSCEKMKLYGLCVAQCGIINPLQWGAKKYGRK